MRDEYITSVDTMYKEQLRRVKYVEEEEEMKTRMASLDHTNLKHVFYKHPRDCY